MHPFSVKFLVNDRPVVRQKKDFNILSIATGKKHTGHCGRKSVIGRGKSPNMGRFFKTDIKLRKM